MRGVSGQAHRITSEDENKFMSSMSTRNELMPNSHSSVEISWASHSCTRGADSSELRMRIRPTAVVVSIESACTRA